MKLKFVAIIYQAKGSKYRLVVLNTPGGNSVRFHMNTNTQEDTRTVASSLLNILAL